MHGHFVHEAVVASGARCSGPTVHFVNEEFDKGKIVAQRVVPVTPKAGRHLLLAGPPPFLNQTNLNLTKLNQKQNHRTRTRIRTRTNLNQTKSNQTKPNQTKPTPTPTKLN